MKKKLLDGLKGLSKPEEKSTIEFSRNPLNELKANYQYWTSIVNAITKRVYSPLLTPIISSDLEEQLEIGNKLYDEAMILTKHQIKGITPFQVMDLISGPDKYDLSSFWEREYAGIYTSALLNNSCLEEITINSPGYSFLGFKLNRGKIKIVSDSSKFIGAYATGGLIENYGKIQIIFNSVWNGSLGRFGSGVMCMNYGEIKNLGDGAKGGVYKNYGSCFTEGIMGSNAVDGIFLNYGSMKEIGAYARGGFFHNGGLVLRIADHAQGGFYLNNGRILERFGNNAEDGFYFNNSETRKFGCSAKGGIYINCGDVRCLGIYAESNSTFITKKRAKLNFSASVKDIIKVRKLRLFLNRELNGYVNDIQEELKERNLDIHHIKRLLLLAKKNCTKNYARK